MCYVCLWHDFLEYPELANNIDFLLKTSNNFFNPELKSSNMIMIPQLFLILENEFV